LRAAAMWRFLFARSIVVDGSHDRATSLQTTRGWQADHRDREGRIGFDERSSRSVGDVYSINGFYSEGRRNVKFYVVKDFDESIRTRSNGVSRHQLPNNTGWAQR